MGVMCKLSSIMMMTHIAAMEQLILLQQPCIGGFEGGQVGAMPHPNLPFAPIQTLLFLCFTTY